MKTVICKSNIGGWQARLQKIYDNYEEFCAYDLIYSLAKRLGYKSAKIAWYRNPVIRGSIIPSDYSRVSS